MTILTLLFTSVLFSLTTFHLFSVILVDNTKCAKNTRCYEDWVVQVEEKSEELPTRYLHMVITDLPSARIVRLSRKEKTHDSELVVKLRKQLGERSKHRHHTSNDTSRGRDQVEEAV